MKRMLLLVAALAFSAKAGEGPDGDDPVGRMRAEKAGDIGIRTPEMQQRILDEAQSEKLRSTSRVRTAATVLTPGVSAWVNIGPTTADLERNGSDYFKVDSGRARKIVVDPTDANLVYFATSGGGVWKTRDALTAVSATTGPHWTPITEGLVSLSVGSLAMSPGNHLSLVLGLGDPFDVHTPGYNIVTSDDGGLSWSDATALSGSYPLGSSVYSASTVRDLAFDPGGAIVLAATDAGLFRSTQGGVGTGWTLVDVDAVGHTLQDCWSIAYAGPHTWVLGSVDSASPFPGHLWQSIDDGAHWTERTSQLGSEASDVGRITVTASAQAAGQPWRVYALASNQAQSDQKDVFRSNDGGASWSSLTMHGCGTSGCAGEHPVNVTDHQPDLNFTHDQASYNQMLVADPANADIVFIGGNLSMGRSTDGGTTWSVMTDWLPFGLTSNAGGLDTNLSTLAQYAHADWHAGTIAHVGGVDYFYGGNDGGLIRASSNVLSGAPGSVTWEDKLNRGIVSHLIYSVASGKERPATSCTGGGADIVWGGLQDNGSRLRNLSGGTTYVGYNQIIGGDGFGVGLGCTASGAAMGSVLLSTYVDRISVSNDSGGTFATQVDRTNSSGASIGLNPSINMDFSYNFKMKVVADLSTDFTYLTPITDSGGRGHVYRTTNNGLPDINSLTTWLGINGTINLDTTPTSSASSWPKPMRGVTAHLRVTNHYAAVSGGRVYVTTDGGINWYESKRAVSTNSTNYLSLFTVAFDPNDATGNTVWAASPATSLNDGSAIPTGSGHLFKCTSAAAAGATCAPSGNGIPAAVPVNVVKVDPGNSNTIYAGTEIGMYRSTDGGAAFARYGTGLPLVSVTDIAVNADDTAIRVSTFGRGFWEIYPNAAAPGGVAGTGDLDFSGVVDGFDLVREASIEFNDRTTPAFNPAGDLVFNNLIDESDLAALIAKLGGLP